jgi:CheY-like chemotaxis protein
VTDTVRKILLVEDEDLNRTLVKAVLARAQIQSVRDAEVIDAVNLATARERLNSHDVDLVLLDMNLPDGNGLTASVLPQDRAAAIEAGCDGFLDKPYAAAELVAIVAQHLPA